MLMPKDTNVAIDSGCASYMSQIHRHWPKRLLFYCCSQLLVKHILIHSILITAMHDTTYTSTVSSEASCTPGLDLLPVQLAAVSHTFITNVNSKLRKPPYSQ